MPDKQKVTRKLSAILSADVKGYSALMADDEVHTIETLKTYRQIISDLVSKHSGRVVDSPGDNILAEFRSSVDAVECAVKIQKSLDQENSKYVDDKKLQFRIGVNVGDVIQDGGRIYGNGVNVAARIESLADPGGVCISRNAYDHVGNKLRLGYEYLGEHKVKNIEKPVRVYKLLMADEDAGKLIGVKSKPSAKKWAWPMAAVIVVLLGIVAWQVYEKLTTPEFEPASVEKMAYLLPEKPSIAVLAFDNMSDDPSQEFFSDGVSEDIITVLSKSPDLFVIARNSTFTYKNKPTNIKQIAEELGVRYVLEGSVRKSEGRVRINAQLIDAVKGTHLWAERYDRDLKDVFALQDEITFNIVTALQVELTDGEQMRMWAKRIKRLDVLLKSMELSSFWRKGTKEGYMQAGQLAQEIVDMAPELSIGYLWLGWYHWMLASWGESPQDNLKKAYGFATNAISLDESQGSSYGLLGLVYIRMGQHEKAIAAGKQAIELDPNNSDVHANLGWTLYFAGRPDEAIGYIKKAIRLDPFPPAFYFEGMGSCYLQKGNYEKALTEFNKALRLSPMSTLAHTSLAVTYNLLGREEEARASAEKALEIFPYMSVSLIAKTSTHKNKAFLKSYLAAMRNAGFPEYPPSKEPPEKPSIAVLPFVNMSDDPEQEYFSDGTTEDIITDLSKIKDLLVISRNSTFTYKGQNKKVPEIANELNVRYVLEGSVRRAGDQIRITAQLIDAKTDHHVWAERFDDTFQNIFELQDRITKKIVSAIALKLSPDEANRIASKGTDSTIAHDMYLKGQAHLRRYTPDDLVKAINYFKQAVEVDPDYSQAYVGLAQAFEFIWAGGRPFYEKTGYYRVNSRYFMRHYIELAMKKPTPRAYSILAILEHRRRHYNKSINLAEKAVALAPNDADALQSLGMVLIYADRPKEAIKYLKDAIRLNPLEGHYLLGLAYMVLQKYEKALEYAEHSLAIYPNGLGAHMITAVSYAHLGRKEEAKEAFKKALNSFWWYVS